MAVNRSLFDSECRVERNSLLSRVFERIDTSRGIKLLDLGSPEPESFAFYNRIGGQICLLDTKHRLSRKRPYSLSQEIPPHAQGMRFDICLLWDCLSYLDGPALQTFGRELSAHLHRRSRVHLMCAYSPIRPFQSHRYAILNFQDIALRPDNLPVPHAHSVSVIEKNLLGAQAAHTLLRPDNRLETLLVSR